MTSTFTAIILSDNLRCVPKSAKAALQSPSADAKALTQFAMALYELVETLRGEHEEAAATVGLTAPQATILTMLSEPTPMSQLAQYMGCDASNVTGIVDRLEAKKLVERSADPADRRIKRIGQTPDGRAAAGRFQRELARASSLANLTPAAKRGLLAALAEVQRQPGRSSRRP